MTLHYVPAGVEVYSSKNQLTAKMENNPKETTVFGKKFKQWRLSDRTISLTGTSLKNSVNIKHQADVALPIFGPTFIEMCGLTKVLMNPVHKDCYTAPFKARGIKSIIDSGGFQMLVGQSPFIDPNGLVETYNAQAQIGMPLDLPVRASVEAKFFDPVSHMIKANDDWILKRLDKGVDLALISHGTNIGLRRRRLDVLDRDANVVAIAGLNIKPPPGVDHVLNNAENLMYVLQRYHKRTEYFHVLGVTAKLWIFMYALIDASGFVKSIGADSVSHRLSALAGLYDKLDFSQVQFNKHHTHRQYLECGCPTCELVQDARIIQNTVVLEAHNLWVRAKQTAQLRDLAVAYLNGTESLKLVYETLKLKSVSLEKFTRIVTYSQEVMAKDKWFPIKADSRHKSLFNNVGVAYDEKLGQRYQAIIERYEKFHKRKFIK